MLGPDPWLTSRIPGLAEDLLRSSKGFPENCGIVIGRDFGDRGNRKAAGFNSFDGLTRRQAQLGSRAARLSQNCCLLARLLMPVDDREAAIRP